MYRRCIISLTVIFLLFLTACQTDKNTVGTGLSTFDALRDSTEIDSVLYYSFDQELDVYRGELEMLCSQDEGIESIVLLNFYGLPTEIDSLSDATISLNINGDKSDFDINSLKIGKIMALWDETATWEYSDADSTEVLWDVTTPEVINRDYLDVVFTQTEDSLSVVIPKDLIENWEVENLNGYNLALYLDEGYISFKSSETSYGPRMKFTYKEADERTEYDKECYFDTYIIPEKEDKIVYENELTLQNIKPIGSFIHFDIDKAMESLSTITEEDRDRIIINKAELVFNIDKDNCTYYSEDNEDYDELDVQLKWVNKEITTAELLTFDDLETTLDDIPYPYYLLSSSTIKMTTTEAVIDISPIVANYLAERIDNNGFVINSDDESVFFGKIVLHGFDSADTLKPKFRIIYTLPELD